MATQLTAKQHICSTMSNRIGQDFFWVKSRVWQQNRWSSGGKDAATGICECTDGTASLWSAIDVHLRPAQSLTICHHSCTCAVKQTEQCRLPWQVIDRYDRPCVVDQSEHGTQASIRCQGSSHKISDRCRCGLSQYFTLQMWLKLALRLLSADQIHWCWKPCNSQHVLKM